MARLAVVIASIAVFLAYNAFVVPFSLSRGPRPAAAAAPSRCNRAFFADALPDDATLEKVAIVRDGGSYGEGAANVAYPVSPTDLPALCAVTIRVKSSATSSYRFGLFLPYDWNSRFLVVGNGGFAGGINWLDMAAGPRYGMASLSTDTGHSSISTDTTWARNQPEKKTDWGWRAIHGSTVLGKELVRAYYTPDQPLTYSYYSGCSTGGRQGLKELQLFPDSFDGALIGSAAWWTSHLNNYVTQAGLYNLPATDPKHLSIADMNLLADEVTRQCDAADGVRDGIVSSPDQCTPDLTTLLCSKATSAPKTAKRCLTPAQLSTAQNVYGGWSLPTHESLYPGLTPSSEKQWYLLLNGTEPTPYGIGYARDFLFDADPGWDWRTSFNASVVAYADAHDPGDATADHYAALRGVRERGGKVVVYHGLADGLVPTKGTGVYWNRTVEALGGAGEKGAGWRGQDEGGLDDFMKLFLVPGMQHCWGTVVDAPWSFGGAFQAGVMGSGVWSVPGFEDAEHDMLMALVDWVEDGKPVESVVATTWTTPMDPNSGVKRQRPICAWPRRAVWDGRGDVDDAESWGCSN